MIADALRRVAGIREGDPLPERRRKLAKRLGRRLPAPAAARAVASLGDLAGAPIAGDPPATLGIDSIRAAWEEWLAAECAAQPVLLVLEDLHRADPATARLVDGALSSLRDRPLLVLALARPEIDARFPELWAGREVQTIRLGPLTPSASERLVRDALGAEADGAGVDRIVARGGGNPFHLEELVRAEAAGRGVSPATERRLQRRTA
jgi:hypothetical protein